MGSLPQPGLNETLERILAICQKMNTERELGPLLDLIAREATSLLDCDRASIFLLDAERVELWSKVALGSDEILRFNARTGIAGACALSGQTINVADAYCDPRFNPAIDDQTGYRTGSILAVPLQRLDGGAAGVFEVLNKRKGAFTNEDEQVLRLLAAQVATAIENAQSIGELARNQAELKKENGRLWREVERKYSGPNILGSSAKIQNILRLVDRIRDSSVSVLI